MTLRLPSWGKWEHPQVDRILQVTHQVNHRYAHVLIFYALYDEASKVTARPELIAHQPHLADYGPSTEELAALISHFHPIYAQDNGKVYDRIERSLTGTFHS